MLGTPFYHQTIRKIVIGFGTLFNNISIRRIQEDGTVVDTIKVPLSYAPKEKFIQRINQAASIDKPLDVGVTLPRLGFEVSSIAYDPIRKTNTLLKIKKASSDITRYNWQYNRAPYNIEFNVHVFVKNIDDGLQIIEQILPYFQPEFNITVKDNTDLETVTDVPIILSSITNEEEYEGDFETRRVVTWTLTFTAKAWIYSPSDETGLIRKVIVQSYPQTDDLSLEDRNTLTPNKELVRVTIVPNPTTADPDDDYTFTTTGLDLFV